MKKQNQIERKNSRENPSPQVKKVETKRINGRMRPPLEIPADWKEVASIDFTGYLDRDCEERIIYKTPEGKLKAARSSSGLEAIEDVSRKQALQWIQECVLPEEFLADFSLTRRPTKGAEQEVPVYREILISKRRADVLSRLAAELKVDPKEIGENAIASYLLFIEKRPDLAEAQPRFVTGKSVFAVAAAGDLYDRLDHTCEVYDLDRNSVVDSAIGAYLDLVLQDESSSAASRELTLSWRGSSDPENIEFILSQATEDARSLLAKLVNTISVQPFEQARHEFGALRDLTMHHPAFKNEREAFEMIIEGAARLE